MPRTPPTAFLVDYRDGVRGTVLLLNGHIQDFCFAAKLRGENKPASCMFHLPPPPGAKSFDSLVATIAKPPEPAKPPYPVARPPFTSRVPDPATAPHSPRAPN